MRDELLCLEMSNLARQLNFNPEIGENHPVITHLTAKPVVQESGSDNHELHKQGEKTE